MLKKTHGSVDLSDCHPASGTNHRLARIGDPFQQGPVPCRAAAYFDDIDAELNCEIDRGFIEGRADGNQSLLSDLLYKFRELIFVQTRGKKSLDVFVLSVLSVSRVNKSVQIAELKLDGSPDAGFLGYGADLANYALAVRDASLMIIGYLEYKQLIEIKPFFIPGFHVAVPFRLPRMIHWLELKERVEQQIHGKNDTGVCL
jgi:hypothetical protein